MIKSKAEEIATTLAKVALVAILGAWSANGFAIDAAIANYKTYLGAGLAAVLAFILTWLDPNDDRYGRGSEDWDVPLNHD